MTKRYENFADASAMILASIEGNEETMHEIIRQITTGDNPSKELGELLALTVSLAGQAIQKDLEQHLERGDNYSSGITYLTAARSLASSTETN